jgi:hypothetical protein
MEHVGFNPGNIVATAHCEIYNWWNGIPPQSGELMVNDFNTEFHDYIIEWEENSIKWYVDDAHYFTYSNNNQGSAYWPFDQDFHLLLNIAIGGTWGGQQGIDDSIFPVRLEVDYVRVYERSTIPLITLTHTAGWNMVGLPLIAESTNSQDLFPESVNGSLYGFNGTYLSEDDLVPGTGYWLNFFADGSSVIQGESFTELTIELSEGWNLISGISDEIPIGGINDPGNIIVDGTIYGFQEVYVTSETIEPGKAYWIYASTDGDITISSGSPARIRSSFTDRTAKANKLRFNGSNLYFGVPIPEEEMLSYQLPPKPPEGAFDVRFADNMKVAENSGTIEIMNNSEQLVIAYDIKDDADWILSGDEEYRLSGSGEIVVYGNIIGFTLNKVTEIPLAYSVLQNYPNPFNPVTTIRYDLPEYSHVSIIIYDLLGRRVTTLVNKIEEPGYKSIVWDGTDSFGKQVSAGVYLYQIRAGNYTRVRKMALLK